MRSIHYYLNEIININLHSFNSFRLIDCKFSIKFIYFIHAHIADYGSYF